jgi:hypothetical protein
MNMILHGIEAPNVVHTNSLTENLSDIQEKDRFDVILANPPFGGKERKEVQQNFPIKTGETAFLFLQHFIKYLKAGGRAAVVIKNTFLSNSDNASRPAQGAAGELQPAHRPRLPRRHLPGCGREDRGAVLREGRADPQGLVLPARSRPQPGQDQPAQRQRPAASTWPRAPRATCAFPSPGRAVEADLRRSRTAWRDRFAAVPFEDKGGYWQGRYYQDIAIERVLEAIAEGKATASC